MTDGTFLLGAAIAASPAIFTAYISWVNNRNSIKAAALAAEAKKTIEAVEIKVDGRLDKLTALLLDATGKVGEEKGRQEEKDREK
jgi:hypothetical protein